MRRYLGRRQSAFTLIELLVVMMILVILAGSVSLYVVNKADQARIARAKADIKVFDIGLEAYAVAMNEYPTTEQGLQSLWSVPNGVDEDRWRSGGGPFIKQQNTLDPWRHEFEYRSPGDNDRDYEIICLGADGTEGGEGKDADIYNWELADTSSNTSTTNN